MNTGAHYVCMVRRKRLTWRESSTYQRRIVRSGLSRPLSQEALLARKQLRVAVGRVNDTEWNLLRLSELILAHRLVEELMTSGRGP